MDMKYRTDWKNEAGFTLIELIIAGLVAMLVVAGIIATMTMSQRSYFIQDRVAEAQQGARIGLELVARDVRMAGYGLQRGSSAFFEYGTLDGASGKWSDANSINVLGGAPATLLVNRGGVAGVPTCGGTATCQQPWTDAVAIHRGKGPAISVKDSSPGANVTLDEKDTDYPAAGVCGAPGLCGPAGTGPVMNCISPEGLSVTIQLTNQGGGGLYTINSGLSNINPPGGINANLAGGACYTADRLVYYVNQRNQLVVSTNWQAPVVVANDVEDLQMSYLRTDGTWRGTGTAPDVTVAADDINIQLVRINLVTRSSMVDPKFTSSPASVVAPAAALENHTLSTATDNLRRRIFTTTVKVRNNG